MFAVVDRQEVGGPWRRLILKKVHKNTWEILNETGDDTIATIDNAKERDPVAEWGIFYRHSTLTHFHEAIAEAKKWKQSGVEEEERLNESPRRKDMRNKACLALKQQGRKIKNATKVGGTSTLAALERFH